MLDTGLLIQALRNGGHTVGKAIKVPDNAGEFEFLVDDRLLTLSQVRQMLESEAPEEQVH